MVVGAGATWVGAATLPLASRSVAVFGHGAGVGVGIVLVVLGLGLSTRAGPMRGLVGWVALAAVAGGALAIGSHRGHAAAEAYRPLAVGPLPSPVTVIGDPRPLGLAGWRIELRLPDGQRVEAVAHGQAGADLSDATVGSTLAVDGRLQPVGDRPWLRTRHVVARATVSDVRVVAGPGPVRGLVEAVRHRVAAGGDVLGDRHRALYRGLVLGDDRFQPDGQVLRFRLAGLSHLLAVSGQNVAFVLTALAPAVNRLGGRVRLVAVGTILVVFALMTRLEPSVLRAVTTAGLSAWATTTGRARSGLGVLAVAVAVLVVADPFLVDSVGFQLSVAASIGILVLTPALLRRVPGPGWVVQPLATGLGAQIGVAPLLTHYFGPVSLVAIPANLAAGWAAGATMIWGMSVGPLAGLAPSPVAVVLQFPVTIWLWWLEWVAATGARLPAPRPGLGAIAVLVLVAMVARSAPVRWPRGLVAMAAFVVVAAAVPSAPDEAADCGSGLVWHPRSAGGASVLVVGSAANLGSVEDCRRAGIRSADLVVVEVGDRSSGDVVRAIGEVITVGRIRAPPQHRVVGARRLLEPARVAVAGGWLVVEPGADGRRLDVAFVPS